MATIKALEKNAEYIERFLAASCDQKARAKVLRAQVALMQKQSAADKEAAAVPRQKKARVPQPSSRWAHLPANAEDGDYSQMAEPVSPSGVDFSEDTDQESLVSDVADTYMPKNWNPENIEVEEID